MERKNFIKHIREFFEVLFVLEILILDIMAFQSTPYEKYLVWVEMVALSAFLLLIFKFTKYKLFFNLFLIYILLIKNLIGFDQGSSIAHLIGITAIVIACFIISLVSFRKENDRAVSSCMSIIVCYIIFNICMFFVYQNASILFKESLFAAGYLVSIYNEKAHIKVDKKQNL